MCRQYVDKGLVVKSVGSCGDDKDGSAEMGGEQDDWMWVCVGWSRGVLWLVRRECVVWFFFFVFGFWAG